MPKIYQIHNAQELFFPSKEEYLAFRAEWKAAARAKTLTAADMAAYALLRGKDLRQAFTPITNPTKLANGQPAEHGLDLACLRLRWQLRMHGWRGALSESTPALQRLAEYLTQEGEHKGK